MKSKILLTIIILTLPLLSIAGTVRGKFIRNLTKYPYSDFKIFVRSNFDGGRSEEPVQVNKDGTFKITYSNFWKQNISLQIGNKIFLSITSTDNRNLKQTLNELTVVELHPHEGKLGLTTGEDIELWMRRNLPYGKLKIDIYAVNAPWKFQGADFMGTETTTKNFVVPSGIVLLTSEEAFKNPIDLHLDVRTAEPGPGQVSLKEMNVKVPLTQDLFASFSYVEIEPRLINTDLTGNWEGHFIFNESGYNNMNMKLNLSCRDMQLSGSVISSGIVYDGSTTPEEETLITGGECDGQKSSFTIAMPFTSTSRQAGTIREVRTVTLKYEYVSESSSRVRMYVDDLALGYGSFERK